jgi:multicomponent Na+:H+ antiporter subunit A
MGVLGYGVAVLYMFYGAVDLAITQFLAETIIMVIFVMVIFYLPDFAVLSSKKSRIRDAIIALSVGAMMTMIVLKARFINLEEPISQFFAEKSFLEGHGRNIVNVILVDFRALDTLGEITVLALAAAGVFTLLRFNPIKKKSEK